MIKYAKELGLYTIFRIFVIDSKAFNAISHHAISSADLIEILPGDHAAYNPKILPHI